MELPESKLEIQKEDIKENEEQENEAIYVSPANGSADNSSSSENAKQEEMQKEDEALTATVMSLFMNLCSVIRNDYAQEQRKMRPKADRKLLRMIRKKEISLGLKYEDMDMV